MGPVVVYLPRRFLMNFHDTIVFMEQVFEELPRTPLELGKKVLRRSWVGLLHFGVIMFSKELHYAVSAVRQECCVEKTQALDGEGFGHEAVGLVDHLASILALSREENFGVGAIDRFQDGKIV